MDSETALVFRQHLLQAIGLMPFALVAVWYLLRKKQQWIVFPRAGEAKLPTLFQLLGAFFLYLSSQALFATLAMYLQKQGSKVLISLLAVALSALVTIFFVWFVKKGELRSLWTAKLPVSLQIKSFFSGVATWLFAFPIVMFLANCLAILLILLIKRAPEEQIAVDFYRETMGNPFFVMGGSFLIGVLVPIVEEVLFRMLLQSYLKRYLSSFLAIIIASVIFAGFHMAAEQGAANVQLFVTLFILSLFLGVLYERKGSLWAPIGLHSAFNFFSMFLLFL